MAENTSTPETPEDIDNMSMEQISELKNGMRGEAETSAEEQEREPVVQQPEPEPTPEDDEAALAAAEADQHEDGGKKSKTVPHKTFNYANERRKNAEKERDEVKERFARLEERTKLLLEAQTKPAAEPEAPRAEEIPDPDTDPHGAIKWLKAQVDNRNKTEADQRAAQEKQTAEQQEFKADFDAVNASYTAAAAADPTIIEAHSALRQAIGEELMEVYGYTQEQALQELTRQENEHLRNIARGNRDVGQYIKGLAKARGWRPGAAQVAQQPNPAPSAPDKLDKARQAGASLGTSGGAVANTGVVTPAMLADMSDPEFAEYMAKNGGTRKAFEGA